MPFAEALTEFVDVDEFATAATLQGVAVTSGVIFDNGYAEPLGNVVEGRAPTALAIASEIPAVAQGQTLIVGGTSYTVRGVEPDGTGLVLLRLEAV